MSLPSDNLRNKKRTEESGNEDSDNEEVTLHSSSSSTPSTPIVVSSSSSSSSSSSGKTGKKQDSKAKKRGRPSGSKSKPRKKKQTDEEEESEPEDFIVNQINNMCDVGRTTLKDNTEEFEEFILENIPDDEATRLKYLKMLCDDRKMEEAFHRANTQLEEAQQDIDGVLDYMVEVFTGKVKPLVLAGKTEKVKALLESMEEVLDTHEIYKYAKEEKMIRKAVVESIFRRYNF